MKTTLRPLGSRGEEAQLLTPIIVGSAVDGPVRVLEAGCGQRWPIDLGETPRHITGVDLDVEALRIRRHKARDLDEEIVGDLRTVELPAESFDVVYCSFVLEHVANAEAALENMLTALRPGGVLIIKVPDGDSVYGFITKHSPFRVHVWYKRYIERNPNAGKPGHAPYPTVYDPVVGLKGLETWAARHGLTISAAYSSNFYLNKFGRLRPVVQFGLNLIARVSRVTGRRLSADHNDICLVLTKPATPSS